MTNKRGGGYAAAVVMLAVASVTANQAEASAAGFGLAGSLTRSPVQSPTN